MKKKIHCSIICCCSAFFYIVFSYKWSIRFFSVFFSSHFLNCYLTPTQSLLGLLLNFNFLDCHVWVHCRCLLQFSRIFFISFFKSILIMLKYISMAYKNIFWFFVFLWIFRTWIASAKALSWSIGSPSLWMVIFCSTRVSTMPSRSVLYCK